MDQAVFRAVQKDVLVRITGMGQQQDISWEEKTHGQFCQILEKIPVFLRDIARAKVGKKAQELAQGQQRTQVTQKDLVDAFFLETPFGFHGPLKSDMEQLGIDYTQYGHDK